MHNYAHNPYNVKLIHRPENFQLYCVQKNVLELTKQCYQLLGLRVFYTSVVINSNCFAEAEPLTEHVCVKTKRCYMLVSKQYM